MLKKFAITPDTQKSLLMIAKELLSIEQKHNKNNKQRKQSYLINNAEIMSDKLQK